jgi:hypothetical protein
MIAMHDFANSVGRSSDSVLRDSARLAEYSCAYSALHFWIQQVFDALLEKQVNGEAAEWSKISHANEIAHTVAGFLLSNGDRARCPKERLVELIREATSDGLIQYSSFAIRALSPDRRSS